jgi:putative thiamine transport system substrate-binding protein
MLINIKNNFVKIFLNSCIFFSLLLFIFPINAHERNDDWKDVLKEASGQTIYFHAWGGAKNINSYIKWASDEVKKKYDITVKHVKVSDTANVVAKILSEKNVKKNNNGTVDLVWINGENFSFMKTNDLLLNEKWIFNLPNSKFLDFANNPSLLNDFGIPTDGMEIPW